jgi:iron complex outermembrane recepter protein
MPIAAGLLFLLLSPETPLPLSPPANSAQHAEVKGLVADSSGSAIPHATVSLETEDGRAVASTETDATGHYRLEVDGKLDATYRERVTAASFRTNITDGLVLPAGASSVADVQLAVGDTHETVRVTADESIGNGQIATVAQAGILGTLSTADMPYSVSSYTSQLVLDQQAQTESDILANEFGIQDSNGRYSEDNYLTMRGFVLDSGQSLLNGMPGLVDSRSPSIENIDRIEIFKGPSSFINGASAYGAVGGTVNLVTKRAEDTPLYRFDGGYSANNNYEGHLDLGKRFFYDRALGIRATLGGRFGRPPVDNQEENLGAGSVGIDYRRDKIHASVDASDQVRSLLASRDALYVYPGFAIPAAPKMTSNLFDHSSSYVHHQQLALAQGDYLLNDHVDLFGAYGYAQQFESYVGPGLSYLEDAQGDVTVQDLPFTSAIRTHTGRAGTRLSFSTGPIRHVATIAGDFQQIRAAYFFEYLDTYETNIYAPIAIAPLDPRIAGLKNVPNTDFNKLQSVALADVATALNGKLVVIGGLRGQWINVAQLGTVDRGANNTPDFTPCTDACSYNKGVPSPSIAAMYHLPRGFSIYANYMQDLEQGPTAPTGAINQNQVFAPYVAKQEEAGAKFEHGPMQATLAVFQIAEPNGVLNPVTNLFGITGSQRNRGLEFSVTGNVLPSLRLISGVSFIDARQLGTGDPTTDGMRAEGVPATQSTVGAEWTVPKVRSLDLSARMTASSSQYVDTAETQSIPAWARLDIGGRYTFKTELPITIRVNIDNVTGQNYFESSYLGLAYTGPRTVRISSGIRF